MPEHKLFSPHDLWLGELLRIIGCGNNMGILKNPLRLQAHEWLILHLPPKFEKRCDSLASTSFQMIVIVLTSLTTSSILGRFVGTGEADSSNLF